MKKNNMFFHGSMFLANELVPGFIANGGKLEEYENGLTNEYFFVTKQKAFALQMGICKLIEQVFGGYHFITDEKTISADVTKLPTAEAMTAFMSTPIFLYGIPQKHLANLKYVPNSMADEYYTEYSVFGLFSIEEFSVYEILSLFNLTILFAYDEPDSDDDSETQFIELNPYSNQINISFPKE